MMTWRDGGTDLFSGGEVRRLAQELPYLASLIPMQTQCKYAEMRCSDGPAWKRKRMVVNYLRKLSRELTERRSRGL